MGPGKCVGLYKISENSGFILVVTEILWDHTFLSDVIRCQKTQVSDYTSSTVYTEVFTVTTVSIGIWVISCDDCCRSLHL